MTPVDPAPSPLVGTAASPARHDVPDAGAMHALGRRLAGELRTGDLVLLSGELGAGKTTLTQGLGEGLAVRGPVTSPTFVLARVHPPLAQGPPLVHVDAYRLASLEELDDLDLDTAVEDAVTVVEWGEDLAGVLAPAWLEVRLTRLLAEPTGAEDPRRVTVVGAGQRWAEAAVDRGTG